LGGAGPSPLPCGTGDLPLHSALAIHFEGISADKNQAKTNAFSPPPVLWSEMVI
jgi:hypothetical protein